MPFLQPFMEAGLDSMSIIDLHASLERVFALDLPATVIFDHPTITALAKHIDSLNKVNIAPCLVYWPAHGAFTHGLIQTRIMSAHQPHLNCALYVSVPD